MMGSRLLPLLGLADSAGDLARLKLKTLPHAACEALAGRESTTTTNAIGSMYATDFAPQGRHLS